MGIFSRKSKPTDQPTDTAGGTPAAAPPAAPARGGELVVNRPVQEALVAWGAAKNAKTMHGVLRQCVTGELLLDASDSTFADDSKPFDKGDTLALGQQVDNAGKRLLVAFTDNDRLAEYRRRGGSTTPPRSLAQPAAATLQMAADTYDGIAIDPGSPETLCIAYADEIRQGLTPQADVNAALKAAVDDQVPADQLVTLAEAAPVIFVGVSTVRDESGEVTRITVPNVANRNGDRFHPAFTSPAEVWAWAPELEARPTGFSNIAGAVREDGLAGIAINPAGLPGAIPVAALPAA